MRSIKQRGYNLLNTKMDEKQPLVSIIVRTCQRPDVLQKALNSIQVQTYTNIQAVIVEDGENASEVLLKTQYADLNYIYEATMQKVGRAKAGNRALELAQGEFINFLDDDDELLPNHTEVLVKELTSGNKRAAYSVAEERRIIVTSGMPYLYKVKHASIKYRQPFNRMLLYTFNYIPIQSIMFHKSLYTELGGFDENLDNLEDWDLWVRYSTRTDYGFVNQVTSVYHIPYNKKVWKKRKENLNEYLAPVYDKFESYLITLQVKDINKDMTYVIREYKNHGIMRYLRMFFRAVLLGDR